MHGSWFEPTEYIFQSTPWQRKSDNLEVAEADVILAGHCGLPFNHINWSNYWLNPGSVGLPANDGTTRGCFIVLNDAKGKFGFTHHSLQYDFKHAAHLIQENSLPETIAQTLQTGLWDNNEILPNEETQEQGIALELDGHGIKAL